MEGFSKMTQSTNKLILDTPVPHISTPILIPTKTAKVKSLKSMAKNAYSAVRKKITDVADWILNLVPEPRRLGRVHSKRRFIGGDVISVVASH